MERKSIKENIVNKKSGNKEKTGWRRKEGEIILSHLWFSSLVPTLADYPQENITYTRNKNFNYWLKRIQTRAEFFNLNNFKKCGLVVWLGNSGRWSQCIFKLPQLRNSGLEKWHKRSLCPHFRGNYLDLEPLDSCNFSLWQPWSSSAPLFSICRSVVSLILNWNALHYWGEDKDKLMLKDSKLSGTTS